MQAIRPVIEVAEHHDDGGKADERADGFGVHDGDYSAHSHEHGTVKGGLSPSNFAHAGFRSIRPGAEIRSSTVASMMLPFADTRTRLCAAPATVPHFAIIALL